MRHNYLLGYDVGSSSVKASLVDAESGACVASAFYPKTEAPIKAVRAGWAEQDPEAWWQYLKVATADIMAASGAERDEVKAIGISYQMHGLVCVDKELKPLRDSIIWCDSRAVPYGQKAFADLGSEQCLSHLLNSPGNFTASKLAWVRENEPDTFSKIYKVMLPGDYIACRLSGTPVTTVSGLSEGMMWDFKEERPAQFLLDYYGIPREMLSDIVPTFGVQGEVNAAAAAELGLQAGTPITYRAGDQPNNALSLNVFEPGEAATTAGTSGVVYGVLGRVAYDPQSRVNTFAHVNHGVRMTDDGRRMTDDGRRMTDDGRRTTGDDGRRMTDDGRRMTDDGRRTTGDNGRRMTDDGRRMTDDGRRTTGDNGRRMTDDGQGATRLGVLLCINGTGILNSWARRNVAPAGIGYAEMNDLAAGAPIGSAGLSILPFGNGAERVLCDKEVGASIHGINFNTHTQAHLLRAAQEGIVFSFAYGMEVMKEMGMELKTIRAGKANMFLSPIFRDTLAGVTGATIELCDTDGSVGAARGAGIGAGIYADNKDAFSALKKLQVIEPDLKNQAAYREAYERWRELVP